MPRRETYAVSQRLGLKILDLIEEELSGEDYFACSIAALEMVKSAILGSVAKADRDGAGET